MKDKQNILIGVGIGAVLAAVILFVFLLGVFIGRGGRHLYRDFFPKNFGHGAMGTIETLGEKTLVVRDRSGALKTVLVDDQTQTRRDHTSINFSQLKTGEQIIVLGDPIEAEGAIKARVIRVMGSFNKQATSSGMMRPN